MVTFFKFIYYLIFLGSNNEIYRHDSSTTAQFPYVPQVSNALPSNHPSIDVDVDVNVNVNANDVNDEPLPSGWERRVTLEGRTYYVDHNTSSTSWDRPMPLPSGFFISILLILILIL